MPRQRVAVVTAPPAQATAQDAPRFLLGWDSWKALLLREGVTLAESEWADAVDLTRVRVGKSDMLRVVTPPVSWVKSEEQPDWKGTGKDAPDKLLLVKYSAGTAGRGVFFSLVDPYSGVTVLDAEATAADMRAAIDRAISEMEDELALFPWRCRVSGASEDAMVIDRGYYDGLRAGQQFVGYTIAPDKKATLALGEEKAIMLHGKKAGLYELTETGNNHAKVVPVDDAPLLSEGDVLEIPEIRLKDRTRKSRGSRLWNKIYRD
jgi:hypothetical protein